MKYKFKLEALLKVRGFKEKTLKIELGKILQSVGLIEEKIAKAHLDINESYMAHDKLIGSSIAGRELQFFPFFIEGKNCDIDQCQAELAKLKEQFEQKMAEVKIARGETKVIENMKDRDFEKCKKEFNKKLNADLEELFIMKKKIS